MNINRAISIVRAKDRPIPLERRGLNPPTCTVWNVPPGDIVQESVYFAYSAGLMKIGYSIWPIRRLASLAAHSATDVTMVLLVPGTEADERAFHARFQEDRVHHEWFRLSKQVRDFLKGRLCAVGRESLKKAESNYASYCKEMKP